MKCNKCDIELHESWKYCPMCATSKEDIIQCQNEVKDNKWGYYVIVSLVLALIVGLLSSLLSMYCLFGLVIPYLVMSIAKKKYSNKFIVKMLYFIFNISFKLVLVILSCSLVLDLMNKVTAM